MRTVFAKPLEERSEIWQYELGSSRGCTPILVFRNVIDPFLSKTVDRQLNSMKLPSFTLVQSRLRNLPNSRRYHDYQGD